MTAAGRWRAAGAVAGLAVAALFVPAAAAAQGVALVGADAAEVRLPAAAVVEPYANAGYRLRVDGDHARVDVTLTPLASRQLFTLPPTPSDPDGVVALARAVVADAGTRYEAVSRLLAWVGHNVSYRLDRGLPQDAASTLARRDGYCTGISRLTVALLAAVGIPAREVPGFVAAPAGGVPAGYHRWVEVHYDDVGWVFSDPLTAHHYVPATYVRLASETLAGGDHEALLLGRSDLRQPADLFAEAPAGVTLRRNVARQRTATLRITVAAAMPSGHALLEGEGRRLLQPFREGASTFVGLEPGDYLLRVEVEGWTPVTKRVILRDRVAASIHLPRSEPAGAPAPPAATAVGDLETTK